MLVAEGVKQIACVASCVYNFSPTTFAEYCCLIKVGFFKAEELPNNRHGSSFRYKLFHCLLFLKLQFENFHRVCPFCSPLNEIRTLKTGCALACCLFGATAKQFNSIQFHLCSAKLQQMPSQGT